MSETTLKVPAIRKPKPVKRGNKKLLAFIMFFFIAIFLIVFFQSAISKVSTIEISGNEYVPTEMIGQAAAIQNGDQFFGVSVEKVKQRIESLSTILNAHVSKKFPGVIRIEIQEHPKSAFLLLQSGEMVILFADGSIVGATNGVVPDKPLLTGWDQDDPLLMQLGTILSEVPDRYLSDISEISPDPSLAYPDKIRMYTRSNFEVYTTIGYFFEKIQYLDIFVAQLKSENIQTGVITMLESDQHSPFPQSADLEKEQSVD